MGIAIVEATAADGTTVLLNLEQVAAAFRRRDGTLCVVTTALRSPSMRTPGLSDPQPTAGEFFFKDSEADKVIVALKRYSTA